MSRACSVANHQCLAPANHPEASAKAVCKRCGNDICSGPYCSRRVRIRANESKRERWCSTCIEENAPTQGLDDEDE